MEALNQRWPHARISGAEILESVRKIAAERFPHFHVTTPDKLGNTQFDVIAAMSVLCRWPEIDGPLPYSLFQSTIRLIDTHLRPGGLLVAWNATYNPANVMEYEPLDFLPDLKLATRSKARLIVRPREPNGAPSSTPHPVIFRKPVERMRKLYNGADRISTVPLEKMDCGMPRKSLELSLRKQLSVSDDQLSIVAGLIEKEQRRLFQAEEQISRLQQDIANAMSRIGSIENSKSWRITKPLRSLRRYLTTSLSG